MRSPPREVPTDPEDRTEPSFSRTPRRVARLVTSGSAGPAQHGPRAAEASEEGAPDLVLRAGDRISVASAITSGDGEAGGRGMLLKAATGGVVLLAIFGAVSLVRHFVGW